MGDAGGDEMADYLSAMADVSPITNGDKLAKKEARPRPPLKEQDEEALVMQKLDELVHGETPFDFADTDEFVEAHVAGFDRRIVRKLKRGEYAVQAHLDLHGFNREQARERVAAFIRDCQRDGKRCVLIIHGRGLGSKDNIPVLKTKLAAWLTRGALGRRVLAYTSARPYDGGTGAVYVLIRQ
jgi:DNA-nicking Smr family endonuclease